MNRSNVRVLRKERRRDRRRDLQIKARLGDYDVLLTDLSAGGFGGAIDATDRMPFEFRPGQRLLLELTLEEGEAFRFPVQISRSQGAKGVFGGVFVDLSDEGYDVIESLLLGRRYKRRS